MAFLRGDFMPEAIINYVAVIVAAIVSMGIGFLWYGPLFGKAWIKLSGMSMKDMEKKKKKGMTKTYVIAFIGTLVMAYVLAHFVDYVGATTLSAGAELGSWLWIGFFAPTLLGIVLWEGKSWKLYLLNVGHYLVTLVVMGAILAVWV